MALPTQAEVTELIADALYPTSANVLSGVCERLGLAPGDRDEAMQSKRTYVRKRLAALDMNNLRLLGAKVEETHSRLDLAEALAKLDEAHGPELGDIARRRIIKLFEGGYSLSGDLSMVAFIKPLWPISTMVVRGIDGRQLSLDEQIQRHADDTQDWSGADVLNAVDAVTCSRGRFFRLLESAVHPRTLDDDVARARLASDINRHLNPDGWSLKVTSRTSGLPVYTVQPVTPEGQHPADGAISEGLAAFDEESVHAAW